MRKVVVGLLGLSLATGWAFRSAPPRWPPRRRIRRPRLGQQSRRPDDLPNPLEDKRRALRERGRQRRRQRRGEARGATTAARSSRSARPPAEVGPQAARPGQRPARPRTSTSSSRREKTDRIFVILAEFGNERHPSYPDQDTDPDTAGPATFDGPLHNEIPEPDRAVDNSTVWQADYNRRALPGTCTSARATASSRSRPTTRRSPRAATASTARSPTG